MGTPIIKVAAIGLGWVTCHRHIPAIEKNPNLKLVGVIDTAQGRAQSWSQKLNLPHYAQTNKLEDVAWIHDVDAVTIGTPPSTHKEVTLSALKHKKHVITEKPFAMNVQEGQAMIEAAQAANKTLSIVHNFQFSRAIKKLQKDLSSGKIGTIKRIAATQIGNPKRRLPSWFEDLPLGLFYDESPHFFYLLNELTNSSLSLEKGHCVRDKDSNTPRLIHLLYNSQNDIPVTIDCQFDGSISEWFVTVTGEKATAIVDIFRDIYIRLPNDETHNALNILRTSISAFSQHFIQHIPNGIAFLRGSLDYGNNEIMKRFAKTIQTGKEDDKIGFTQALDVLKLQHEAVKKIGI